MWTNFIKWINRLVINLTMIILIVMVLIVFLQILTRALMNSSFTWTEELARFLMIWMIYLGAGFAFQYGAHISVGAVVNILPKGIQKIIPFFMMVVSLIFFIVLFIKGVDLSKQSMGQLSPVLRIPMGYLYIVFPVSALLQSLNMVDITVKFYRTGQMAREEY